ncbi:MAG: RHS repeat protein, partial [Treponema sp.]|nr:RHS repeat protein [Treponema sp.]
MAEGSGGFTGTRTEGSYNVTYENGEEIHREFCGGGSGNGSGGDGGRGAKISSILNSCKAFLSDVSNILSGVWDDLSSGQSRWTDVITTAVGKIKESANKHFPQKNRTTTTQKAEMPMVSEPANPAETVQPEETESDPVIKSSGLNRQTNTDISMGTFGGIYAVTRHHAPCADKGGLLGSSWASSLDTRIIRGLDPDRSEEINRLKSALSEIQAKKAQIEGLDNSYDEVKGAISAALSESDSAIATVSAELGPLEEAQTVREKSLELNRHVMYGGAEGLAGCGDGKHILMKDGLIPLMFERTEAGSYKWTGAARLLSVAETGGGYTLTNPDGGTQGFDSYGRLARETDRNGNEVKIQRSDDGIIEEIISSAGCSIKVKTDDDGHIAEMQLLQDGEETGLCVKYEYDGDCLASATDSDGDTSRYEYDEENQLTAIVKSDGSAIRYAYIKCAGAQCADGSLRVASVTDEEGQVMSFSHDPAARRFSYRPALGDEETSFYDEDGRITREESGGLVTEYEY